MVKLVRKFVQDAMILLSIVGAFWVVIPICFIVGVIFVGCGSAQYSRLEIGHVGGDMWVRSIANRAQMEGGSTRVDAETPGMPTAGIPPIGFGILGKGMGQAASVRIGSVSGNLFWDSALDGSQGVPIPDALEKLFIPGNPFSVEKYHDWNLFN